MTLQVNQDLCRGCGICAEICEIGAIRIAAQTAWIETSLCTQCQACVDACPHGAITAVLVPLPEPMAKIQPVTEYYLASTQPSVPMAAARSTQTWAALTRLGQVTLPYLLDGIALLLERRQAVQSATAQTFMPGQAASFHQVENRSPVQRRRRARQGRYL